MTKLFLLFSALAVLTGKPSEQISLKSKTIQDVTSSSAPAYWTAECGDRTYVGSYTLMMDWTECRYNCQYFPHAGEHGHSFTFADILDTDTKSTSQVMAMLVTTGLVAIEERMDSTGGTLENHLKPGNVP